MLMTNKTKTVVVSCAAATAQTLPEEAAEVVSVYTGGALGAAGDTLTAATVVVGAPAAAECQFTGTPKAPSAAITLGTAAAAGQELFAEIVPVGGIARDQ